MNAAPLTRLATKWQDNAHWQDNPNRLCRNTPPEMWFPVEIDPSTGEEVEPALAPPDTKKRCDLCPVRVDCLTWALREGVEGIWAGTTTYERTRLNSGNQRKRCVTCGSIEVVTEKHNELCLACGVSWPIW